MINRPEEEIIRHWPRLTPPVLSILCITYNHERFVSHTLDGFLMQETTFPFEIVIGEDCSTDNTRAVVAAYQEKYPRLIRLITSAENVGGAKNFDRTLRACAGRYIAFCEGDDYWTDPKKLQIQVDFLEKNPDYAVSGHDCIGTDADGLAFSGSLVNEKHKRDFPSRDVIMVKMFLFNMTRVWRNVVTPPPEALRSISTDTFMLSLLGNYGKSKYHPEIKPTVYRRHGGGVWTGLATRKRILLEGRLAFWRALYYARKMKLFYALHATGLCVKHALRYAKSLALSRRQAR